MLRLSACLAVLTVVATPAFAERPDVAKPTFPLCEVWASTEAPNVPALLAHEHAHCWGWVHPVHGSPLLAKTKAAREAYRAYSPPLLYRLLGEYPNKITYFVTEKDAAKECGSWGCASGGLQ